MAKLLKLRRGTTTQHASFTGAEGEVTIDTTKDTAVVHDGAQAGGRPMAREDMSNVSSASIAGQLGTDSIATTKIAAGALPTDVTVADANISGNLTIVNADVTSTAAIAGTKISPDFGSQNIATTGTTTTSKLTINANTPTIELNEGDGNPDYKLFSESGVFKLHDSTNGADRFVVNTDGHIDIGGNLDCGAGIDVTGAITATGDVTINSAVPTLHLNDTNNENDFSIRNNNGTLELNDVDGGGTMMSFATGGQTTIPNNLDCGSGVDVTGNISCTGTVDGRDVAADGTKLDGIESSATADQTAGEIVSLVNGQTITPAHLDVGTGRIGGDSTDYFAFTNNTRCDLFINNSNEFRFENDGDFHADGDVIAQSTTISSDINLKENIQVVPDALDKVESLRGVTFDWKRDGTPSAGVIAQEVQGVLPEAVKEVTPVKGGESHLSVNYHALTSILIEAIKELKAEVEELKGGK